LHEKLGGDNMTNELERELTPQELQLRARERKKMASQLKTMQSMWVAFDRMTPDQIDSLNNEENDGEMRRQWRMHNELWAEYDHKPVFPKTCLTCGKEVGKCENKITGEDGELEWYNDECRECFSGEWYGTQ